MGLARSPLQRDPAEPGVRLQGGLLHLVLHVLHLQSGTRMGRLRWLCGPVVRQRASR